MSGASRLATDAPLTPLAPPPTDAIDVDSETDLPPRRQAATRPVDSTSTTASDDVRTPLSPAFGFISALADMPSAALRFASPAAMNPPAWPGREEEASTSASASASKARSESLAESPESVTATRQRPRPLELDGSVVDLSDPPLQTPASTVSTSSGMFLFSFVCLTTGRLPPGSVFVGPCLPAYVIC
jgi:hypothetical protein